MARSSDDLLYQEYLKDFGDEEVFDSVTGETRPKSDFHIVKGLIYHAVKYDISTLKYLASGRIPQSFEDSLIERTANVETSRVLAVSMAVYASQAGANSFRAGKSGAPVPRSLKATWKSSRYQSVVKPIMGSISIELAKRPENALRSLISVMAENKIQPNWRQLYIDLNSPVEDVAKAWAAAFTTKDDWREIYTRYGIKVEERHED